MTVTIDNCDFHVPITVRTEVTFVHCRFKHTVATNEIGNSSIIDSSWEH